MPGTSTVFVPVWFVKVWTAHLPSRHPFWNCLAYLLCLIRGTTDLVERACVLDHRVRVAILGASYDTDDHCIIH